MEKEIIAYARRCIFPEGRFVLMGYNRAGKEVFGIGHKAKTPGSGIRWARSSSPKQDRERVQKAYDEWWAEQNAPEVQVKK